MILSDKRRASEITQIKSFDLGRVDVGIFHGLLAGFDGEGAQVTIGERSEMGLADADNGDRSHNLLG